MPMTLHEARGVLMDSVLHAGECSFSLVKQDRAIRVAFEQFLRQTRCTRTVVEVTVQQGADRIDVTDSHPDFMPGCLIGRPFILSRNRPLQVVSFESLLYRRGHSGSASGVPELVAWQTPSAGYLFPNADAQYAISFPYWQPLVKWDIGTNDAHDVVLNVPDRYADQVIWTGAKSYLVMGAPGHPDGPAARSEFYALIESAKGELVPQGTWYSGADENFENSYSFGGRV